LKRYRLPNAFALSESTEKIQLFRIGTFYHSQSGKVEVSSEMLSEMKKNFDSKIRGVDIAIDYKHDSDDIAAGWIKGLVLSDAGDELFAEVEWTPNATF